MSKLETVFEYFAARTLIHPEKYILLQTGQNKENIKPKETRNSNYQTVWCVYQDALVAANMVCGPVYA